MPVHDDLGKRMKEFYEGVPKTRLVRRMPVAVRIDGCHFHSFTKGFKRPFDDILISSMQETAKFLCENIMGCVLSYQQSDEITLVLVDYKKLNSEAYFDYEVQKLCSVIASMATMKFNSEIMWRVYQFCEEEYEPDLEYVKALNKAVEKGAMFDARCFNIPKEEVCNLLYWRQLDATRNSIQMLGQSDFSHKELQNKSCNDIQDMFMTRRNINWNDLDTWKKRGSCCVRNKITLESDGVKEKIMLRDKSKSENEWVIDKEIPIFSQNRAYIEDLIMIGE